MDPLHFHQLKCIAQSPAHYRHFLTNKSPPTKAMRLGTAVDALVSSETIVSTPEAWRECWCVSGLKNQAEAALALGMYASLRAHRDAWSLLTDGARQQVLRWSIAGRECEGTPDLFSPTMLTDLKTTRSAHPDKFQRDARWRGYHAQLSWYRYGLVAAGYPEPKECALVTVENVAPFVVTVFAPLTERALEQGEKLWRGWFERLRVCEDINHWPGYTDARVPFDVPDDGATTLTIGGEEVEVE